MPHLESNIPPNIYYASIGSEILRFVRTNSESNNFITIESTFQKNAETGQ